MDISLLKESFPEESRVLLNPNGVGALVAAGHRVYVQTGAGERAGWKDTDYSDRGALIAYSQSEAIARAEIVAKVQPPSLDEIKLLQEEQLLVSFLLIASMSKAHLAELRDRRISALALESVRSNDGSYPLRQVMSEIGGRLAVQMAGTYLQTQHGGRGILMPSLPSVPGAQIAVIGAGAAGISATRAAIGAGARVLLLDRFPDQLRTLPDTLYPHLETMVAIPSNLMNIAKFVDVLISAVHMEDLPAPHVVSAEMIKAMKPGSVVVDLAIDQGGSIETSRPTSLRDPVFVKDNVTHLCVPNLPAAVGRTASHLLTNLVGDMLLCIAEKGTGNTFECPEPVRSGITLWQGKATRELVSEFTGLEYSAL